MKWFQKKRSTMFTVVRNALIFVAIWGVASTGIYFGWQWSARAILNILVALAAAYLSHIIWYMVEDAKAGKEFGSLKDRITANWKKVQRGVPDITALIIALRLQIATPIYIIIIAAVIAEILCKLMWGGFGKNKLNPVAASIILTRVIFDFYLHMPMAEVTSGATPLSIVAQYGWYLTPERYIAFNDQFGGLWNMLFGGFSGIMAETTRFASILAFFYLLYKKTIKWHIPVFYVGTVLIATIFVGLYHGFVWNYSLIHVLSGGLIFGAVFMATDPVTIPKNRAGQIIFTILLALLTLVIRFRASMFDEGVVVSLLIMNMFAGYINDKTAALNKASDKKQWLTYGAFVAGTCIVVFLLAMGLPY